MAVQKIKTARSQPTGIPGLGTFALCLLPYRCCPMALRALGRKGVDAMIGALIMRWQLLRVFAAMRRKDLQAVCGAMSDDAVFEFPGRSTLSGRYEGREAVEGFWRRAFERYQTFNIRPIRIALVHPYAFGATNIGLVEWVLDGVTHDGITPHFEGVAVVEVRRGKMVHGRDYFFDPWLLEPVWGRREEHTSAVTGGAGILG